MQFLYPAFLFSLIAVVIPVIIHLFSFRRYKTVYFSNVGFLKDIKKESRKKSRLKHLLILIARILTLVFLIFAFAQPYIPKPGVTPGSGRETIAVYIDNSFSMNALSEKGKLLEEARNKAVEIARSYPAGTKFRLYTNDLKPKHRYSYNKEQFIREVTQVRPSPSVVPLSMIYNRFNIHDQNNENNTGKTIFLISDFQQNITDVNNFSEKQIPCYLLPLFPAQVNNLYIDSCWMDVPAHGLNQEENIFVKIINRSDENYKNLPLNLYLNDSLKSITNFNIAANSEITATLKFTNVNAGMQVGKIEITDYPFTHDNSWYISYYVESRLRTLAIYSDQNDSKEGLGYISSLFKKDDYVLLDKMDIKNLQISKIAEYSTIFLINNRNYSSGLLKELVSAVSNGSSVVVFPYNNNDHWQNNSLLSSLNCNLITGIDTVKQSISGINFNNRFFENVFRETKENAVMPQIDSHLKFEKSTRSNETNLLWFQNGDKALSVNPFKKGKAWIFSFPLEKKNEEFARDIIFIPSIYNIVLNSLPDQRISYTIGRNQTILIPKSVNLQMDSNIEVVNRETENSFVPGLNITSMGNRLEINNMIKTAGHYLINNRNKTIISLAFNYDRNESELTYFNNRELEKKINSSDLDNISVVADVESNFEEIYDDLERDKHLWKYCVFIALMFIFTEVIISRFWK